MARASAPAWRVTIFREPPSIKLMNAPGFFAFAMLAAGFFTEPRAAAGAATPAYPGLGAGSQVAYLRADWFDARRDRKVPVKIYFPSTGGPFPVIVFSHGLGGSREGYEYLGRYWAAHGYVSAHIQHLGSDDGVWFSLPLGSPMAKMRKAAADPENSKNRPLDVSFAIDQLEKMNRDDSTLRGRLDLTRIGVGGHSFGAYTALAVAGEVFVWPGGDISLADPRVKAAIAMSSPAPLRRDSLDRTFGKIKIPVYHMTGTEDDSPIGETRANERRIPFDHIRGADQFLLTIAGGDHMIFAGRWSNQPVARERILKELICESSLAFWDACLKGDTKAETWLTNDFKTVLGREGVFEFKSGR